MVPVAAGKHRRPEAQLPQMPDAMPSTAPEPVWSPAGAADPAGGANSMWGPAPGGIHAPPGSDEGGAAALSALGAGQDWPLQNAGIPFPHWDAPPPALHPDHPSAPIPQVRLPGPSGPPARRPADDPDPLPRPGQGLPPGPGLRPGRGLQPGPDLRPSRGFAPGQGSPASQGSAPGRGWNDGVKTAPPRNRLPAKWHEPEYSPVDEPTPDQQRLIADKLTQPPASHRKPTPRQKRILIRVLVAIVMPILLALTAGGLFLQHYGYGFFAFRPGGVGETPGNETDQQFLSSQHAHR